MTAFLRSRTWSTSAKQRWLNPLLSHLHSARNSQVSQTVFYELYVKHAIQPATLKVHHFHPALIFSMSFNGKHRWNWFCFSLHHVTEHAPHGGLVPVINDVIFSVSHTQTQSDSWVVCPPRHIGHQFLLSLSVPNFRPWRHVQKSKEKFEWGTEREHSSSLSYKLHKKLVSKLEVTVGFGSRSEPVNPCCCLCICRNYYTNFLYTICSY